MTSDASIVPVLLSGGTGSRLWPLSREARPKQLLSLLGEKTLLQQTVARVDDASLFHDPLIIANGEHRFLIAEQLRAIGKEATIVLEPVGRSTAPAGGSHDSRSVGFPAGHRCGPAGRARGTVCAVRH